MNTFIIVSFYLFIISIDAQVNIIRQIPNITTLSTTHQFIIQINGTVNPPQFPSFIRFNNPTTNTSISQIDVSANTSNTTYSSDTLTFHMADSIQFNITDEFYITFEQGVLFSNRAFNSSAQFDRNFWYLKIIANSTTSPNTTTIVTSTITSTSTGTTYSGTIDSSMTYTSTLPMTTMVSTYTSMNQSTTTTTVPGTTIGSDQSATRSAQLGMGFGITFITIIIIGEIIYFKYCYSGSRRSGSYFT